jgi:uncharacterized membrane protein
MRLKVLGHPVHPMLIVFPLGLFVAAVVFDAIDVFGGPAVLGEVAFWNIAAGLIGSVLAALTGLVDWTGIPAGTRAKRIGLLHGGINALVVLLFLVAWLVRLGVEQHAAGGGLFVLELVALVFGGVSGWLGGELVDRLGIGVDPGANPDAPSSLSGRPAAVSR